MVYRPAASGFNGRCAYRGVASRPGRCAPYHHFMTCKDGSAPSKRLKVPDLTGQGHRSYTASAQFFAQMFAAWPLPAHAVISLLEAFAYPRTYF